jgi:beta-glucuronidase
VLYPQANNLRELQSLDGFWEFQTDPEGIGEQQGWMLALPHPEPMAVPSSFNELTADPENREYIGDFWYLYRFFVPVAWEKKFSWIRFGSVNYRATVWINGRKVIHHEGGHLPFQAEISGFLNCGAGNTVAVKVNNILGWESVPPGFLRKVAGSERETLRYYFDFFNYAGIHRSVHLYATNRAYLEDVVIQTYLEDDKARVKYKLFVVGNPSQQRVLILDAEDNEVDEKYTDGQGEFLLTDFQLWDIDKPYLYKLKIELFDSDGKCLDQYIEKFGIRTVAIQGERLLLNGKPVYLKGCCRHDDFELIGRGLNLPVIQKDLNLLKWLGANSFRTSHYPYAEELMQLTDRLGLLVIDEVPAVGMNSWGGPPVFNPDNINEQTKDNHIRMLKELYQRDKNHPSVIMWSVGNEPNTTEIEARPYFEKVNKAIRDLDSTRPVTLVLCSEAIEDKCGDLFDVICVNRYFGWYTESGNLDAIEGLLKKDLDLWHEKYRKPVMLTEFGADTIAGFHSLPAQMFTEEFQVEFLRRSCETLERLDYVLGEHVWVLADFMTVQGVRRVMGNKKGVFTRNRQPKMAAFYLKSRWKGEATLLFE